MNGKKDRDIEREYTVKQMVSKLRRLAHCLENGKSFHIQIAGERISIPPGTAFTVEHEREGIWKKLSFSSSGNETSAAPIL